MPLAPTTDPIPVGPVLVATDLGETATAAIRTAHELAAARGVALIVLHVVPFEPEIHPLFPHQLLHSVVDRVGLERRIGEALEQRMAEVVGDSTVPVRVAVAFGAVPAGILRHADESEAGLVVIGAGESRLGAVGAQVVRYASTPVLVVRGPGGAGGVLGATDLSDPAVPAVEAAAREAQRRGAPLTLHHHLELGSSLLAGLGPLGPLPFLPDAETRAMVRAAVVEVLEGLLGRFGVEGDCRVTTEGDAANAIVSAARELGAALVVVGTRGRTGLRRIALGSVAESVVREAPCSVLAVRLQG